MRWKQLFALPAVILLTEASSEDLPAFVQELIEEYETASDGHSRIEIWQYEYQGESVFYLPLARILCCDVLSVLYSAEGDVMCWPDGGFTGRGDGKCPDFNSRRSEGVLVWGPEHQRSSEAAGDERSE